MIHEALFDLYYRADWFLDDKNIDDNDKLKFIFWINKIISEIHEECKNYINDSAIIDIIDRGVSLLERSDTFFLHVMR